MSIFSKEQLAAFQGAEAADKSVSEYKEQVRLLHRERVQLFSDVAHDLEELKIKKIEMELCEKK